ncbi:MAG: transcription/translation regulatory transformer protein RfaH [Pseudomonadota bacterium]
MGTWFLIYCKPKQDIRAEENLMRQGFHVFRPTINVIKAKIGCENSISCESLFPRYVFLNVNPEVQSIGPVLSTLGVASFVKFGDRYATVSERLINEIKVNAETQSLAAGSREAIKEGDEIYVNGCGFDQVKAIYYNPCGNMRALILMNIMGKEARLSVPVESISKVVAYSDTKRVDQQTKTKLVKWK